VAYSSHGNSGGYRYPQELDFDACDARYHSQQYETPPSKQYWDETYRCWRYVNPNIEQTTTAPALRYPSSSSATNTPYESQRNATMYASKRQLSKGKLEVLDYISPLVDGRTRYEHQGQRAGPWDPVVYVPREERRR
jgi:hypothetical protein